MLLWCCRFNKDGRKGRPDASEHFLMADQSSSLLGKNKKRVSIAPNPVPCTSTDFRGGPPGPQVATTVFLQHETEKKPTIPTIEVPDMADFNITDRARMLREDSFIELQNLELGSLEVSSVSSHDSDGATVVEMTTSKAPPSKLKRTRQPAKSSASDDPADVSETCLSVDDRPEHSGIVLSPSKLGQ